MSKATDEAQTQIITTLQKTLPSNGTIATGLSVQGDTAAIVKVSKAAIREAIDERVKERSRLLAGAKADVARAEAARDKAALEIVIEEKFLADLDALAAAFRVFEPSATTTRKVLPERNFIDPTRINYDNRTMVLSGSVLMGVQNRNRAGTALYDAHRTVPLDPQVAHLHDAVLAAKSRAAAYQGDLVRLQGELHGLDKKMETMEANLTRHIMKSAAGGEEMLKLLDTHIAAATAALDKDMSDAQ